MRSLLCILLAILALATLVVASAPPHHPHRPHHHSSQLQSPRVRPASLSHSPVRTTTPAATSATLNFYQYSNSSCTFSSRVLNTYPSGQCWQNYNASYAYFCDSEAGYRVTYSESTCQPGSINTIERFDFGCRADGAQTACVNPELGPPLPFTWPPENFIIQTQCMDGFGGNFCSADASPGVVCDHIGSIANVCVDNVLGSNINYCTEDGEWFGYAQYASKDCSDAVNLVDLTNTMCNSTFSNFQCTGSPLPLTQYPSVGLVSYNDSSCAPSSATSIEFILPGACVDGLILTCDASNSTMTLHWFGWGIGQCSSPGTLYQEPTGQCTNSEIAFCDGAPIQI